MAITATPRLLVAPPLAIGFCLLLFVAVYAPAFVVVGALRLPANQAALVIILLTFALACILIGLFARRPGLSLAAFGFRPPPGRYWLYALAVATPLSALAAWALSQVSEPGPLAGLKLAPWLVYLYFVVGAPIQEEVIFRGLLQTVFARTLASAPRYAAASALAASLAIAALFGAIHLVVGPLTALAAVVLGVLAGELRRRAGSLGSAIVCHAIFNLGGILWALRGP